MTQLPSGLSTRPETFAPASESNLRLQRAVESLNLNLDDELHRYRQARSGQVTPTPARLQLRTQRKPIDLITVKSTAATATAAAAAPPPPPNARLQEILGQSSTPSVQAYPPQATVNQVRMSHGGTLTTYRPSPEDYLESTEALLGSLPNAGQQHREPAYVPSFGRQLATPLGVGALLLLLVTSAGFGYLVTSPQAIQHLTDNAITRRLKGDPIPADSNADSVALDGLESQAESGFKPLGPDLSEKEFASLDLNNISTLPSADSPKSPAAAAAPGTTSPTMVGGQPLPISGQRPGEPRTTGPRPGVLTPAGGSGGVLRAEIVTAPRAAVSAPRAAVSPRSVATAAPARSAPAPATAPAARVAPPAASAQPPRPLAANRAPAAPPAPIAPPAVAPPAPITQAPPQATAPSYYVVTDYNGAQSLESARSAVGDAYVRNFSNGTRIQMGAFSQPSSAQNLVNELQGQGIPAQVISP
ncbi:SPOR domain-containing protein [Nodosilinea sp. FACHB-13]|uniref:SPOR domain-containing protein n=1 Tax=Cyanophyceae TaxID=3028117 RepID=UPI0016848D83|nr:SPOR domain-containing protein [Nodosilinea sp. FACHB-13]MBD2108544.1 SPOR domain-containing protein [Nodosilinea sp. FACHB-13]